MFTSAATFDALEMGHRVIQYFMDQGCYGVYVTQVDELAKEDEQIVSMVAQLAKKQKAGDMWSRLWRSMG